MAAIQRLESEETGGGGGGEGGMAGGGVGVGGAGLQPLPGITVRQQRAEPLLPPTVDDMGAG